MDGCKEMHDVWIRTLAVKNGYGDGMLYGHDNWWKIFCRMGVQNNGSRHGFVFRMFHEISRWKTNCAHNVISLWSLDCPITCKKLGTKKT